MSKRKLFWLYVSASAFIADEFGDLNDEFWKQMKQDAKDCNIKWDDDLAKKHYTWLRENLK